MKFEIQLFAEGEGGGESGRISKGSRAAKDENGKRIKIPADMNYNDWKKVYIDKTQTLADWRKAKDAEDKILREKDKNSKIRVEGREIIKKLANGENVTPRESKKGLGAGDRIFMNIEGTSPKLVGKLPNLENVTIYKALEHFEKQIANAKIENAFTITASGDIYHCTGHLNGLPTIEELGEKLNGAIVTHNHPAGSVNEHSFSGLDFSLFERFNLKILHGVDEYFLYELNRNPEDTKLSDLILDGKSDLHGWHNVILLRALDKGFGYRRWRRE